MTVHWRLKCRLIGAATTAFRCWYDVPASRGITVMRLRRQLATCPPATRQALRLPAASSVATFCSNYRISCDVRHRRNCCPLFVVGGVAPGGGGSCFVASRPATTEGLDRRCSRAHAAVSRSKHTDAVRTVWLQDVKNVLTCFWNIILGKVIRVDMALSISVLCVEITIPEQTTWSCISFTNCSKKCKF